MNSANCDIFRCIHNRVFTKFRIFEISYISKVFCIFRILFESGNNIAKIIEIGGSFWGHGGSSWGCVGSPWSLACSPGALEAHPGAMGLILWPGRLTLKCLIWSPECSLWSLSYPTWGYGGSPWTLRGLSFSREGSPWSLAWSP
jgi:hypothetical protein